MGAGIAIDYQTEAEYEKQASGGGRLYLSTEEAQVGPVYARQGTTSTTAPNGYGQLEASFSSTLKLD